MDPPTDVTSTICDWIHSLSLDDIPSHIQTRAKYIILDGIGCGLLGARLPWSERAAKGILSMGELGKCSIIGWDRNLDPLSAALLNSTFIQGFELDDWHIEAPLHSCSILLPALFAAVAHSQQEERVDDFDFVIVNLEDAISSGDQEIPRRITSTDQNPSLGAITGSDFLLAALVGFEVGPRVGNGLYGTEMLTRGWHSGAVFGPAASSASVSKLLGLSPDLIEDAIGMACTQACGLMSAQYESDVKRMQHGFASRNGLFAALMVQAGYTGIKKIFDRPYGGFLSTFSEGSANTPRYRADEITNGLGSEWKVNGIRIKPYAAMAGTHCTIDCIRSLQDKYPERMCNTEDIQFIQIEMGEAAFRHGGWSPKRPITCTGAQMSNSYICATQILDGQVMPPEFRPEKLDRDEIWTLVYRTTCEYNPHLGDIYAQRVTIRFKDGVLLSAKVEKPRGIDPALTNEEILAKWKAMMAGVISDIRRQEIEELVLHLEDVEDVRTLIALLCANVNSPLS